MLFVSALLKMPAAVKVELTTCACGIATAPKMIVIGLMGFLPHLCADFGYHREALRCYCGDQRPGGNNPPFFYNELRVVHSA